ncbi:calcium-binding protein [Pseudomonas beijingensis]|uniref:calcium-binding protein n=1 Tax=Pseudomonas beijingensis TaxID=2954101 RepID=UPI002735FDA0|nr:calcium-binding protein [Pseudomonas sp. FP830]WLI46098.1 calcium-binding protein [Pseudomonas sp. FP830]
MAKVFYPGSVSHEHAVVVTDLGFHANDHSVETLDFKAGNETLIGPEHKRRQAQLEVVDKLYGPLRIGSVTVTRLALDALGVTTNGQPLNGDNTFFRTPNRFFLNTLRFNPVDVETRIKLIDNANDYRLPTLLFEIASERSSIAPPLLNDPPETQPESAHYRTTLEKLLNSAQKLNTASLAEKTFKWVNRSKSNILIPTGFGLQAFGIYSGLRGLQDAIRNKNGYQAVFNGASVSAEVASIGVEAALTRQATHMLKAGQSSLGSFAKTSFALRLGRGSGLIASVLTLPFDIVAAIDAFKAAANATGNEATDHYVNAALSITSAAMSVMIGAAALAGFTSAGPVGLAAGLILAVGSQVWGAIREVDEIDNYIELTVHERLRTGWFAFWTISPDEAIQERYTIAKATAEHTKQLRANAMKLLQGTLKNSTEAIVNGKFSVELEQVTYNTWNWWTGERYQATRVRPRITDSDDFIDARDGVTADTPGAVLGTSAEHKGIHWYIGGGNDTIIGPKSKPNVFHYGAGVKQLTGGEKDDVFIFEGSTQSLTENPPSPNRLVGGAGSDTVILSGRSRDTEAQQLGYHVDLEAGQITLITQASQEKDTEDYRHAVLESIEHVEILEGGRNIIKGTAGPNIIKSRGDDAIEAGAGDDQIFLLGANNRDADGGPGNDVYAIAHKPGRVSISEDGIGNSVIAVDWRADLIEGWKIEGDNLVVTSGFDADDWQLREVIIKKVYQPDDDIRYLQNNKLTFITKDGYHLVPDLPDTLEQSQSLAIEAVITQQGTPRNPIILNNQKTHRVAHDKDTSYYLSRLTVATTLQVTQRSDFTTTVHLDYASTELTRIEAHYNVLVTHDDDGWDTVKYGECGLTIYFGSRHVVLKNLASSDERYSAQNTRTKRRAFSALGSNHLVTLIMKDGVSYRLVQPAPDYGLLLNETLIGQSPVNWTTDVALPLTATRKQYVYLPPSDKPPYYMRNRATCAQLTSPSEQTGIEVLIGEGATYLVHLSPDMTLRLSTPGALAGANPRLPQASTWELDATRLGHVEINLASNRLQLGTTIIHLPTYEAEDLVDKIRVITAQGVVHAVDTLFERVYVEALDARYFTFALAPSAAWPSELAAFAARELRVLNIAVRDGTRGGLTYNLKTRQWTLETDKARPIVAQDLRKTNLCDHHLSLYQDLAREGLSQTPPANDGALRLLREKCVALVESLTPGNSKFMVQTLTLSLAFGMSAAQLSGLLALHGFLPAYL